MLQITCARTCQDIFYKVLLYLQRYVARSPAGTPESDWVILTPNKPRPTLESALAESPETKSVKKDIDVSGK